MANIWCEVLGIKVPSLERVKDHREANTYSLLIVALLERGESMTLLEVAERFAEAGIASTEKALRSLKMCRPARPPIYRDGGLYSLDPHDGEADLWAFRLGLRPPKVQLPPKKEPEPLPGNDVPLTIAELEEAWEGASLDAWSHQRVVLAVLDAFGEPMPPIDIVNFVGDLTQWHVLNTDPRKFKRKNAAVEVLPDGKWAIKDRGALPKTRDAVREKLASVRRYRPDPEEIEARIRAWERKREQHAAELAKMRRALLYGYPRKAPQGIALLDVDQRQISTFIGEELRRVTAHLAGFDCIGSMNVRPLLKSLGFDPGKRQLAELNPPQQTYSVEGVTLRLTTEMLIYGSCMIEEPFGDERHLGIDLQEGNHAKARRRLEASVKSLYAFYQYGRLHGAVRVRTLKVDDMLPAPWIHADEPKLQNLMNSSYALDVPLRIVLERAPDWSDPWARSILVYVEVNAAGWACRLAWKDNFSVDGDDVQLAKLDITRH